MYLSLIAVICLQISYCYLCNSSFCLFSKQMRFGYSYRAISNKTMSLKVGITFFSKTVFNTQKTEFSNLMIGTRCSHQLSWKNYVMILPISYDWKNYV